MGESSFRDAIRRIRAGDEEAATQLVRQYERLIRREVRLNLEDQRLRRVFDSMDVAQSVMASFFGRMAAGQYDLDCPEQLIRLLLRMARNKLASAARKEYQQCRDARRTGNIEQYAKSVASEDPTPCEQIGDVELLGVVREQLTAEERELAELRAEGFSWGNVAERLGGNAQARRMQLARAIDRVAKKLGLVEFYE